jgi:hypothetical protein
MSQFKTTCQFSTHTTQRQANFALGAEGLKDTHRDTVFWLKKAMI